MFALALFFLNKTAGGGADSEQAKPSQWVLPLGLLVMVAVMYFATIGPQKKRQKEEQQMRDALSIGDEITTIGGILGRVITIKDDSIVIETGADRTKLRMLRTAIGINNTAQQKITAEREAARRAQQEARANRNPKP